MSPPDEAGRQEPDEVDSPAGPEPGDPVPSADAGEAGPEPTREWRALWPDGPVQREPASQEEGANPGGGIAASVADQPAPADSGVDKSDIATSTDTAPPERQPEGDAHQQPQPEPVAPEPRDQAADPATNPEVDPTVADPVVLVPEPEVDPEAGRTEAAPEAEAGEEPPPWWLEDDDAITDESALEGNPWWQVLEDVNAREPESPPLPEPAPVPPPEPAPVPPPEPAPVPPLAPPPVGDAYKPTWIATPTGAAAPSREAVEAGATPSALQRLGPETDAPAVERVSGRVRSAFALLALVVVAGAALASVAGLALAVLVFALRRAVAG